MQNSISLIFDELLIATTSMIVPITKYNNCSKIIFDIKYLYTNNIRKFTIVDCGCTLGLWLSLDMLLHIATTNVEYGDCSRCIDVFTSLSSDLSHTMNKLSMSVIHN